MGTKLKTAINHFTSKITDWQLLKGSAMISIGTIVARVLGFAFSIVLARIFTTGDYGAIQYSITVASVVGIVSQPMGQHVLSRFIGRYSKDPEKLNQMVAHIVTLLAITFILSLIIAAPFLNAIHQLSIGVLVIFFGETLFYSYWGMAAGTQNANKLTIAYLSSNLFQLILVVLAFQVFNSQSTMLALIIYGSSYLLPLLILQFFYPLPIKFHTVKYNKEIFIEIIKFSFPKLVSHASYIGYRSLDIFLLEYYSTPKELGAYLLSRTIVSVFLFIPRGISSLLMPKVASVDDAEAKNSLNQMVIISLAINVLIFAFYMLFNDWAISTVFGENYKLNMLTYAIMGLTAIFVGMYDLINSYSVGKGSPAIETFGYLIAVALIFGIGSILVPNMHALGIAIAKAVGIFAAFIPFTLAQRKARLKNKLNKETI
ncbi:oligosaccharide flippase family protein [bacterium]|nr:oligosaccharide flippase family protein [bacterium]